MSDPTPAEATGDRRRPFPAIPVLLMFVGVGSTALAAVLAGTVRTERLATLARGVRTEEVAIVALALVAVAALAGWRGAKRRSVVAPPVQALRIELSAVREENARLRLQDQRVLSVGRAAERIRQTAAAATADGDEESDQAWDTLTQAMVMRTALSAMCQDLQSAVGHMQRRLTTMIPGPELDRRLDDRRGSSVDASRDRRAGNGHNGHNGNGNGHNGNGHNGELSLAATTPFSPETAPGSTSS